MPVLAGRGVDRALPRHLQERTLPHTPAEVVEGPVSARWPGTILQHHPKATVVVDEAAASLLELADYYRFVHANKPEWQRYRRRTG